MLEHINKSNNDMYPNTISKKLVSVPDDILEEEKLFKTMNVFANFVMQKISRTKKNVRFLMRVC